MPTHLMIWYSAKKAKLILLNHVSILTINIKIYNTDYKIECVFKIYHIIYCSLIS